MLEGGVAVGVDRVTVVFGAHEFEQRLRAVAFESERLLIGLNESIGIL